MELKNQAFFCLKAALIAEWGSEPDNLADQFDQFISSLLLSNPKLAGETEALVGQILSELVYAKDIVASGHIPDPESMLLTNQAMLDLGLPPILPDFDPEAFGV